ncbi:MAG: hypothetical protein WC994_00180 [Brumimicrobium sp.]
MKILLASVLLIFSISSTSINDVRLAFQKAEVNATAADSFKKMMEGNISMNQNLQLAYHGAAVTLVAKHSSGISTKISLFKEGKGMIEQAVKNNPNHIEIRLVRLMIQSNTPAVLGYKSEINEDKNYILSNFDSAQNDLKTYIRNIAKDTDVFTEIEKEKLK